MSEMAEALTLRWAMIICMELTLDSVTFEGDSQVTVQAVNSLLSIFIEISPIVFGMQYMLGAKICMRSAIYL